MEKMLRTEDFSYYLPSELIAQEPLKQRDKSRMLVLKKDTGKIEHFHFKSLPLYLNEGDVIVLNDTRVIPARLKGVKKDTGGKVELLLLHPIEGEEKWEALCSPGKKVPPGAVLSFGSGELEANVMDRTTSGGRIVNFTSSKPLREILYALGEVPLPPYIKKALDSKERYQTIYAQKEGSVAAPTAGLHFTPNLLEKLESRGIKIAYLTLHVGLDTFRPLNSNYVEEHEIHSEYFELPAKTADTINHAREKGNRIVAVGTTCCRVLETLGDEYGKVRKERGETNLFIYPGHSFKVVDAMVTNFHLPRSTVLVMICAFGGTEEVLAAYREAVKERYRFYSFGDAMLIL